MTLILRLISRRDLAILLAAAMLLLTIAIAACTERRAHEPPLNVLLITLDTTRADALGTYGGRAVTPSLDQLASSGVVFEQTSTVAPLTLPAHASLFTALFPPSPWRSRERAST